MNPVSDNLQGQPARLGFMLIEGFALMSYASVMEPFRAANRLSGRLLYQWRHYGADACAVRASNGLAINVDAGLCDAVDCDLLFVCAGGNPALFDDKPSIAALRRLAVRGTVIGGVSGGPFILARAGLLDGYRCTIHWEHEDAFVETFPRALAERGLYSIDRRRVTCAGGIAGLDLAIDLIAAAHGPALAQSVGDWYIRTQYREAEGAQRASAAARYRVHHAGLVAVLSAMEDNIATPLARENLASIAGTSVRQLERLFAAQLRTTLNGHYLRLRLEAARRLLRETDLSRCEIAIACGFASPSHFSRCFKSRFSITPGAARHGNKR